MSGKFPVQTGESIMTNLIGLSELERQPDHLGLIAFLVNKGFKRVAESLWVFGNVHAYIQTRTNLSELMRSSTLSEEEINSLEEDIVNSLFGQSNVICCFFDKFHEFEAVQSGPQAIDLNITINWENLICMFPASNTLWYMDDKKFWDFLLQKMESKTGQEEKQNADKN